MTKDDLFVMVDGEDDRKFNPSKGILKDNTMPIHYNQRRVSFAPEVTLHKFKHVEYAQSKRRRITIGYEADGIERSFETTNEKAIITDQPEMLQDSSDDDFETMERDAESVIHQMSILQGETSHFSDLDNEEEKTMELTGQVKLSPSKNMNSEFGDDEEQTMDLTGQIKLIPKKLDYSSPKSNDETERERIMELSGRLTLSPRNNEIVNFSLSNLVPQKSQTEEDIFHSSSSEIANLKDSKWIADTGHPLSQNDDLKNDGEDEEETMELTSQIKYTSVPTYKPYESPQKALKENSLQAPPENLQESLQEIAQDDSTGEVRQNITKEVVNLNQISQNENSSQSIVLQNPSQPNLSHKSLASYSNLTDISEEDLLILRNEGQEDKKMDDGKLNDNQKAQIFTSSEDEMEPEDMELTEIPKYKYSTSDLSQGTNEEYTDSRQIPMEITESLSKSTAHQLGFPEEKANEARTPFDSKFENDSKHLSTGTETVSDLIDGDVNDDNHEVEVSVDLHSGKSSTDESLKDRDATNLTTPLAFSVKKHQQVLQDETNSKFEPFTEIEGVRNDDITMDLTTAKPFVTTLEVRPKDNKNGQNEQNHEKQNDHFLIDENRKEHEIAPVPSPFILDSVNDLDVLQNQESQPMELTQNSRVDIIESYGDLSENNVEEVSTIMVPLAEVSHSEVVNEEYTPVTLNEFMEDIHVNFYDDLDMGKSYRASISNFNLKKTFLIFDYAKSLPKLELLALYEFSCAELKKNIEEGRKVFAAYNETIIVNNPPLFNDYYSLDLDGRLNMNLKFQQLKDYTRFQSRDNWYAWRKQLITNLIDELTNKQQNLLEDERNLDLAVSKIQSIQHTAKDRILRLKQRLAYIRKCKHELSQLSVSEVKRIKSNLFENVQESKLLAQEIEVKSDTLDKLRGKIESARREYESLNSEITELKLLKNYEANDIKVLDLTLKFLHKYTNLNFLGMEGKTMKYIFDDTFLLKFDFEDVHNGLEISVYKQEKQNSKLKIKNNFLFDKVVARLISFVTSGSIIERFRLFFALWNGLKKLDEEIYKISLSCPITWDYKNDTIFFSYVFYNFENSYKLGIDCSLGIKEIFDFRNSTKVNLEVLRGGSLRKEIVLDDLERAVYKSEIFSRLTFASLLEKIGIL